MADAMQRVVTFIATVLLQLRNGSWVEGRAHRLGEFIVLTGEHTGQVLGANSVKTIVPIQGGNLTMLNQSTTREREHKMLYHYMLKDAVTGHRRRIITNEIPEELLADYEQSLRTHRPVGSVYAINQGRSRFWFLEYQATGRFTITVCKLAETHKDQLKQLFRESNMSYPNPGGKYGFFIRTSDLGWGLHAWGVMMNDLKKTAKRAQEITRSTEIALRLDSVSDLDMHVVNHAQESDYDGFVVIHPRILKKAIRQSVVEPDRRKKLYSKYIDGSSLIGMTRMDGPWGIGKGRYVIDPTIDHDVVIHACNIKAEITFQDILLVFWPESTWHTATWDSMSPVNFRTALRGDDQTADLKFMVDDLVTSLTEKSEIPDWLTKGQPEHDENGLPVWDHRLSDDRNNAVVRWNMAVPVELGGIAIASNLMWLVAGGMINQMRAGNAPRTFTRADGSKFSIDYWKRMWTVMRNACAAPSFTWSALTNYANYTFPDQDGSRVFYDARFGWVWPDHRFAETFDLHDGHDGDDHHSMLLQNYWCSDPAWLAMLKQWGVIDTNAVIPTTAEEARPMAFCWRLPNGPGAYSIEEVDAESVPWHKLHAIRTMDLRMMPLPLGALQANQPVAGLPNGRPMGGEYTAAAAWKVMVTAMENPGVGGFINALTSYSALTRGRLPKSLPANTSDMIDVVNQGGSRNQFRVIAGVQEAIEAEILSYLNNNPNARLDAQIAHTRLTSATERMLKDGRKLEKDRYTQFLDSYTEAIKFIQNQIRNQVLQGRNATPLIKWLNEQTFSQDAMEFAADRFVRVTAAFDRVSEQYKPILAEARNKETGDPWMVMTAEYAQSAAIKRIVDTLREDIYAQRDPNEFVLALWQYCVAPAHKLPLGKSDRLIFQAGSELAVMDIVIEALVAWGIIDSPPIS